MSSSSFFHNFLPSTRHSFSKTGMVVVRTWGIITSKKYNKFSFKAFNSWLHSRNQLLNLKYSRNKNKKILKVSKDLRSYQKHCFHHLTMGNWEYTHFCLFIVKSAVVYLPTCLFPSKTLKKSSASIYHKYNTEGLLAQGAESICCMNSWYSHRSATETSKR